MTLCARRNGSFAHAAEALALHVNDARYHCAGPLQSLGQQGMANTQWLLSSADTIVSQNNTIFGIQGGPVDVIIYAIGGATDGTGGLTSWLKMMSASANDRFPAANRSQGSG